MHRARHLIGGIVSNHWLRSVRHQRHRSIAREEEGELEAPEGIKDPLHRLPDL